MATPRRTGERLARRARQQSRSRRSRFPGSSARCSLALLVGLACWAVGGRARAHEPFEITADARTGVAETTMRLLIAGHTARLLCGALPQAADAGGWQRCGGALFTLTGADGRRLPARHIDASVTVEGDVAVAVQYPAAPGGPLRFEATFLQRLPDPTYGATLTVTGPGIFLGQRLLRASAPVAVVVVPSTPAGGTVAASHERWPLRGAPVALVVAAVIAAMAMVAATTLAVRARRRPTA